MKEKLKMDKEWHLQNTGRLLILNIFYEKNLSLQQSITAFSKHTKIKLFKKSQKEKKYLKYVLI